MYFENTGISKKHFFLTKSKVGCSHQNASRLWPKMGYGGTAAAAKTTGVQRAPSSWAKAAAGLLSLWGLCVLITPLLRLIRGGTTCPSLLHRDTVRSVRELFVFTLELSTSH